MRLSFLKVTGLWIAILFVLGVVALSVFMPKLYKIPQNGMYPSLPKGSRFWVRKNAYKSVDDVRRGDVIVFHLVKDGELYDFIWRVVGLPGDRITVTDSSVILNDKPLDRRRIREEPEHVIYSEQNCGAEYLVAYKKQIEASERPEVSLTVPDGEFFLLGDNRNNAWDCRYHGTVKFEDVIGKKGW